MCIEKSFFFIYSHPLILSPFLNAYLFSHISLNEWKEVENKTGNGISSDKKRKQKRNAVAEKLLK